MTVIIISTNSKYKTIFTKYSLIEISKTVYFESSAPPHTFMTANFFKTKLQQLSSPSYIARPHTTAELNSPALLQNLFTLDTIILLHIHRQQLSLIRDNTR